MPKKNQSFGERTDRKEYPVGHKTQSTSRTDDHYRQSPPEGASEEGVATIEARGHDLRAALEAGLRAILAMAAAPSDRSAGDRAAPIHGAGDEPDRLFADLVECLLAELEDGDTLVHDVRLDGVLRRDDSGYVGWGYAIGAGEPAPVPALPRLTGVPTVVAEDDAVIVRASVRRS